MKVLYWFDGCWGNGLPYLTHFNKTAGILKSLNMNFDEQGKAIALPIGLPFIFERLGRAPNATGSRDCQFKFQFFESRFLQEGPRPEMREV